MKDLIPTLTGQEARKRLTRMYGLPNASPTDQELVKYSNRALALFITKRVMFVDDYDDGRPVAYWMPDSVDPSLL